jgi:two-component system sensor histidine kinase UhpB
MGLPRRARRRRPRPSGASPAAARALKPVRRVSNNRDVPFDLPRSLFWRVALCNAAVLLAVALVLAISPDTVSAPLAVNDVLVLGSGALLAFAVNAIALRRALRPLERLAAQMATVDPLGCDPEPLHNARGPAEVAALTGAFDAMARRLHAERRHSAHLALRAEEHERGRIARELHDDVGQSLTVLLLELAQARRTGSPEALAEAQATARAVLHDVRQICHQLRPESLDDLGLSSALTTLATRVSEAARLPVEVDVDAELPPLAPDAELVLLRVAQEGLTNVVRHSGASRALLELKCAGDGVSLRIADDGRGIASAVAAGGGLRSMRERAVSVGGKLSLATGGGSGLEVRLDLDAEGVAA